MIEEKLPIELYIDVTVPRQWRRHDIEKRIQLCLCGPVRSVRAKTNTGGRTLTAIVVVATEALISGIV